MLQLYNKKYSENELICNIQNLDLRQVIQTQTLSVTFCKTYILNSKYHSCEEDTYIDIHYILQHQKHLKLNDFV